MRKEYLLVSNDHPNWNGRAKLEVEVYTVDELPFLLKDLNYEDFHWDAGEEYGVVPLDNLKPYYTITELEEEN